MSGGGRRGLLNQPFTGNKQAFTLAEVLITLVIIGIVSALTMPMLSALWQKEALKSAFTKTYSDLNNFSRKFYNDHNASYGEYAHNHGNAQRIIEYIMPEYFTNSSNFYGGSNKPNNGVDTSNYTLRTLSGKILGTGISYSTTICDNSLAFADASGKFYIFNDINDLTSGELGTETNGPIICVDTNGLKGPNRYGYDYFLFVFTVDGRVIPMGMEDKHNSEAVNMGSNGFVSGSNYCKKNGTNSAHGASCAYYALVDKSPSNSSKSYWKDFI